MRKWMGAVPFLGAAFAYWFHRQERYRVRHHLRLNSEIAQTARGPVEYVSVGSGPAVVVAHGFAGGYDQGLLGRFLAERGYRLVAVSRPGYLRTPLATGKTFIEQADALAALMDTLGIAHATVCGISMGGPAAMHFALRHPGRCDALMTISAVCQDLDKEEFIAFVRPLTDWSFPMWLVGNLLPVQMTRIFGPLGTQARRDPNIMAQLRELTYIPAMSFGMRKAGMVNDAEQNKDAPPPPIERLTLPTLVIHGDADPLVPLAHAQYIAGRIPGAELVVVPGGSHAAMVAYPKITRPAMVNFLNRVYA